MLCDDCKTCIDHNPDWPDECEWSPYCEHVGDVHFHNLGECVLATKEGLVDG